MRFATDEITPNMLLVGDCTGEAAVCGDGIGGVEGRDDIGVAVICGVPGCEMSGPLSSADSPKRLGPARTDDALESGGGLFAEYREGEGGIEMLSSSDSSGE